MGAATCLWIIYPAVFVAVVVAAVWIMYLAVVVAAVLVAFGM